MDHWVVSACKPIHSFTLPVHSVCVVPGASSVSIAHPPNQAVYPKLPWYAAMHLCIGVQTSTDRTGGAVVMLLCSMCHAMAVAYQGLLSCTPVSCHGPLM
jgi:hypothetical protein